MLCEARSSASACNSDMTYENMLKLRLQSRVGWRLGRGEGQFMTVASELFISKFQNQRYTVSISSLYKPEILGEFV